MYYRMKTKFLSQTLTDVLDDDEDFSVEFNVSQLHSSEDLTPAISELLDPRFSLPDIPKEALTNKFDHQMDFSNEFDAVEQSTTNDNAWNEKLNKTKPSEKPKAEKPVFKKKLSLNIEPVMMKPLRNPKKSLSRMKTFSGTSLNSLDDVPKEVLPDLETILLEKSRGNNQQEAKPAASMSSDIKTSLDIGWLDRNTSSTSDGFVAQASSSLSAKSSFGLSNLNMKSFSGSNANLASSTTVYEPKFDTVEGSDNEIVGNSDDEEEGQFRRPLLHIAKKRRLSTEPDETDTAPLQTDTQKLVPEELRNKVPEKPVRQSVRRTYAPNDFLETIEEEKQSTTKDETEINDEEDAQQSESSPPVMKRKRSLIKRSKDGIAKIAKKASKILSGGKKSAKESEDEETKPEEEEINFLIDSDLNAMTTVPRASQKELKTTEKLFDNYLRQNETAVVVNKTGYVVDAKTAAKKYALEKKIATGTLNENYVRVNLKKKVFVRGKKAFSFSKYKKGIWKSKKAAALSGPEMDMRGCDGGVLKCFNCDGVGHFAQNCKKKGDNLLPIDVDVKDESPFPTLEEAAQMANDQRLLVHSNKPDQIPTTSNQAWKDLDELSDEENDDNEGEASNKENKDRNTEQVEQVQEIPQTQVRNFLI